MRLSWNEIRARAARFADDWRDAAYEKGETQSFYNDFFEIFGVKRRAVARYEERVAKLDDRSGFIDLFWPGVLIVEQKSAGRDLARAYGQAGEYFDALPEHERPRHILVSDFQTFELHDLDERETVAFPLADLPAHVEAFGFILGVQRRTFRDQDPANIKAAELVGRLHDALAASGYRGHDLERFLVRIVFCLFGDDTGIFEPRDIFLEFIESRTSEDGADLGPWLSKLFQVLDTPEEERAATLDEDLARFPYVNGDAVRRAAAHSRLRRFHARVAARRLPFRLVGHLARHLRGAVPVGDGREGTARPGRALHHRAEHPEGDRAAVHGRPAGRIHTAQIAEGQPAPRRSAAVSGEAGAVAVLRPGLRLRQLPHHRLPGTADAGDRADPRDSLRSRDASSRLDSTLALLSHVDVDQFYGIELGEFPARIAATAMWMMDHIMNNRLSLEFGQTYTRIPLRKSPHIVHGDALETDWADLLPPEECSFVFGNPPFSGFVMRSQAKQAQSKELMKRLGASGSRLDYVAAWFLKAGAYFKGHRARIGFVATNSITQGEQVAQLWPALFERYGLEIAFAHRTFAWGSDARGVAHVHVVIIGLSDREGTPNERRLFTYEKLDGDAQETRVAAISPYLVDAGQLANRHLVVTRQRTAINGFPRVSVGTKPVDGGNYIFDAAERAAFLEAEPEAARWLRPFIGAREYLQGGERWILALHDAAPDVLARLPRVRERIAAVRAHREASTSASMRKLAGTPTLYHVNVLPTTPFLVIPEVSSERREYVPIGWLEPPVIPSNKLYPLPDATLADFALLTSAMHMAWLRHVGGRLESRYSYSSGLVYNTFPDAAC